MYVCIHVSVWEKKLAQDLHGSIVRQVSEPATIFHKAKQRWYVVSMIATLDHSDVY
jgi:hypothetical protein